MINTASKKHFVSKRGDSNAVKSGLDGRDSCSPHDEVFDYMNSRRKRHDFAYRIALLKTLLRFLFFFKIVAKLEKSNSSSTE